MFPLIKILGIVILVKGIIFLLNPNMIKKCMGFWQQGKRISAGGTLNILLGILFLLVASACKIPIVVAIIGIISLIKGIAILALGPEKMKAKINWWMGRPANTTRLIALIVIAFGALLHYSI